MSGALRGEKPGGMQTGWGDFGSEAEAYEFGRPGWPLAAIDAVGLPREAEVLDLGAGTGKLTRMLALRFARVHAVEPDPEMRRFILGALAGTAESIPLADRSVDAVFIGEAFHWFCDDAAVAEIARVLRPHGTLALLWNVPLNDVIPDEVRRVVPHAPLGKFLTGEWRRALEDGPFGAIEENTFEHETLLSRDELVAFYSSFSWIASQPPDARRAEIERFAAALRGSSHLRRLRTELYRTVLR